MAVTGVTEQAYKEFLAQGGTLRFRLEAADIDPSGNFEKSTLIAPFLTSGFELKPSPIIEDPLEASGLLLHGDSWTRVIVFTYRRGGTIVYRRLADGSYEAQVSAPSVPSSDEAANT